MAEKQPQSDGLTLGIETSTARGGVALRAEGTPAAEGFIDTFLNHSSRLIVVLDQTLKKAGAAPGDIRAVGAGIGPGSFTGIRVGLAAARGIAYSLQIPLYGVSSIRALVEGAAGRPTPLAAVVRARAGWYYYALFRREGRELVEERPVQLLPGERIREIPKDAWIVSPDFERISEEFPVFKKRGEALFPSAAAAARLAEEKAARGLPSEAEGIEPLYLGDYTKKPPPVK